MKPIRFALLFTLAVAGAAFAGITVPSGNWDGSLVITEDTVIDLGLATDGAWDSGISSGEGIYDADQWAVVFHYNSVSIADGATLTFANHPKNPPVVWIVQNEAVIEGTVALDGFDGSASEINHVAGGPGGFRGGRRANGSLPASAGFGPGGADTNNLGGGGFGAGYGTHGENATYGGVIYGTIENIPLIGGSGGSGARSGGSTTSGGGGGGGALLIAAADSIRVDGEIRAQGGGHESALYKGGGGSGGALRLVSGWVGGAGWLRTEGGGTSDTGGSGRIRIEGNEVDLDLTPLGEYSIVDPGAAAQVWPEAGDPAVQITLLNGVAVPADPLSQIIYPMQDVDLDGAEDLVVELQGENIADGDVVKVFVTRKDGLREYADAGFVSDDGGGLSTWTCTFSGIGNGMRAIQARVIVE